MVVVVVGVLVVGVLVAGALVAGALVTGVLVVGVRVAAVVPVFPMLPLGSDGDGDTEPSPPEPSAPSPGTELLVVVAGGVVVVVVLVVNERLSSACWTTASLWAVGGCGARKANMASTPTATASDTNSVFLSQRLEATPLASPAALAVTTPGILIAATSLPLGRAS